jgi:hypothetical protein
MIVPPELRERESKKLQHSARLLEQILKVRDLHGIRLEPKNSLDFASDDRFPAMQFVSRRENSWQTRKNIIFREETPEHGSWSVVELLKDKFKEHGFEELFLEAEIIDTTHAAYYYETAFHQDLRTIFHGIVMEVLLEASSRGLTILLEDVFNKYEWILFDQQPVDVVIEAFEEVESLELKLNLLLGELINE